MDIYQSAMVFDRESTRQKWRQANAMKARVSHHEKKVKQLADKIFGPTHALVGTANTFLFLRGVGPNQTIPSTILGVFIGQQRSTCSKSAKGLGYESEEAMCEQWFTQCRKYMNVVDKYAEVDSTARGMAAQYKILYNSNFTSSMQMDCALDAYANYKIIKSDDYIVPSMDDVLKIYGVIPTANISQPAVPTNK